MGGVGVNGVPLAELVSFTSTLSMVPCGAGAITWELTAELGPGRRTRREKRQLYIPRVLGFVLDTAGNEGI